MESIEISPIAAYALLAMMLYGIGEMLWLTLISRQVSFRHDFWQPLRNAIAVTPLSSLIPLFGTGFMALAGHSLAPISLEHSWYMWIIGLLIYEFWYWVQHFLAHKVRLLWCLHSPHHAPDNISMVVGYNHHLLEVPYMAFFLGFMPAVCGVPVEIIIAINVIDAFWGSLLHISPRVVSKRYGPLEHFLQTPSYHRVHHAKNPMYMDTNYNSMTLFWDWAMGTLQPLRDEEPVQYGITRDVDVESWRDVQLGEMALLWRDIQQAPGLGNKLRYMLMPPGWSHTGNHNMASTQKQALTAQ
ncbi:sterol desaturase family protein [Halieaceae bacterium IMCC14734]|uniref:Sterol desaturase family protein n=1 Tax=Candidatus Litorirhabdus singularis TaxID=2518993 RepID=A0ABT3TB85_9GAMM|nr:sterol desaturase family protein [Candidatus Litorirhabdus singularis]MCX2979294.1 sterol desaturase family protein [Candidatus Litorirhabdus singularis]